MISRLGSRLAAGRGGWAFAAYLAVSFLFLGIPVAAHPERDVVGGLFTDPQIFVWSFAWWPHAVLHGLNPIYTHQIWAPTASTSRGRRASRGSRSPSRRSRSRSAPCSPTTPRAS